MIARNSGVVQAGFRSNFLEVGSKPLWGLLGETRWATPQLPTHNMLEDAIVQALATAFLGGVWELDAIVKRAAWMLAASGNGLTP